MKKKDYQSRNLRGRKLIEYKNGLKLNTIQREILVGTLLGDSSISKSNSKTAFNVKFEQKLANEEYINHLYEIFEPYVGTPPDLRNIKGGEAKDRQSIWFRTYRHIHFKFYYDLFYRKQTPKDDLRKKRVPDLIHKFLTPRALAYWFMDDGSYIDGPKEKKRERAYVFNTQSFSYEENTILKETLKLNFNLDTSIYKDRKYYLLYIKRESKEAFINLIEPFILDNFKYKLYKNPL